MSREVEKMETTTSDVLWAASKWMGVECATANKMWYMCRKDSRDPEKCLSQGAAATRCGMGVIEKLNTKCGEAFSAYRDCLSNTYQDLDKCRKQQDALHECWKAL